MYSSNLDLHFYISKEITDLELIFCIALIKSGKKCNIHQNIYKLIYLFIFLEYNILAYFSIVSRYFQTLTMDKGFVRAYKHIQPNCKYPSSNSIFAVPQCSLLTSKHDSTNDCSVTIISHKQNLPVSNLTTTMQVDTGRKNDEDTQYFSTSRKKSQHF